MRSLDERLKQLLDRTPVVPRLKQRTKKQRKSKTDFEFDPTMLDQLSESELVSIAHRLGYDTVSRAYTAEDIVEIVTGTVGEDSIPDVLSNIRETIHDHIRAQAGRISAAALRCDRNCPACPHHLVIECYTTNRDLVE